MSDATGRTALDIPCEEWRRFDPASAIRRRSISTRPEIARRRRRALQAAKRAAQILRKSFEAKRVVLFGSLVENGGFTQWSDIDLAAWGIPPQQFYAAVAAVTALSNEFKIDLVDAEVCPPTLRDVIDSKGKEI